MKKKIPAFLFLRSIGFPSKKIIYVLKDPIYLESLGNFKVEKTETMLLELRDFFGLTKMGLLRFIMNKLY